MQEEVENRTVTLIVSTTKFTGRMLKDAIAKYLAHQKNKKQQKQRDGPVVPHGKQTVKQLVGQNQGVTNIELEDPSSKEFERIARKYGVDYAIKKDRSSTPPKYLIFFKAKDSDALTAAFTEYTQKKVRKAERPSVLEKLRKFKELVVSSLDRNKRRERERLPYRTPKKLFSNIFPILYLDFLLPIWGRHGVYAMVPMLPKRLWTYSMFSLMP